MHLDVVGFQTHGLGLWEALMVAEVVEGVLQGHLQHWVGAARRDQRAVMLKAMIRFYRGNLSLQEVSNVWDIQTEKTPHAILTHWSRGWLVFFSYLTSSLSSLPLSLIHI